MENQFNSPTLQGKGQNNVPERQQNAGQDELADEGKI